MYIDDDDDYSLTRFVVEKKTAITIQDQSK